MQCKTFVLSSLSMVLFVLGSSSLIVSDHDLQPSALLVAMFFIGFGADGLMVLTNWRIMEVVPERMSGRALGLATILAPLGTNHYYNSLSVVISILHISRRIYNPWLNGPPT